MSGVRQSQESTHANRNGGVHVASSILLSRDNGSFVTEVANGTSTVNTTSSEVPALITTQAYQMTQMQRSIENGQNEIMNQLSSLLNRFEESKDEMCQQISECILNKFNNSMEWSEKGTSVKERMQFMTNQFGELKSNMERASNNEAPNPDLTDIDTVDPPIVSDTIGIPRASNNEAPNPDLTDIDTVDPPIVSDTIRIPPRPHSWSWVNQGKDKTDGWVPEDFDIRGKTFYSVFTNHWFNGWINPSDAFKIRPFGQLKGANIPMVPLSEADSKLIKQQVNWGRTQAGINAFISFIVAKEYDICITSRSDATKQKYDKVVKSVSSQESESNTTESTFIRSEMLTKYFGLFISQECGRTPEDSQKLSDKRHTLKVITIGKWYKETALEREGRKGETRGRKKRVTAIDTSNDMTDAPTSTSSGPVVSTMDTDKRPRTN